jgi:hypothetical protein
MTSAYLTASQAPLWPWLIVLGLAFIWGYFVSKGKGFHD